MHFSTLTRRFAALVFIMTCLIGATANADPECQVFRVHLQMRFPTPPSPEDFSLEKCISHYEKMDSDGDGVKDWTSKILGSSSRKTLYPLDPDQDGDGIENVFDPSPLDANVSSRKNATKIPDHLAIGKSNSETRRLQSTIFRDHGILALDHSDLHHETTLVVLDALLRIGFRAKGQVMTSKVRFVYAFLGHDRTHDIAGYHPQMNALSIGGATAWKSGESNYDEKIRIAAALAHEFGHDFIFARMTPASLTRAARIYGAWPLPNAPTTLFERTLFENHPERDQARIPRSSLKVPSKSKEFVTKEKWRERNVASEYALSNVHEWFADAFASVLLQRLGENGEFGEDWRAKLIRLPSSNRKRIYWTNYNNFSPEFRRWLENQLNTAEPVRLEK